VQIDLDTLPDDPAILQQMLRDMAATAEQRHTILQVAVQEREAENDKLRMLIQCLLRHQFGRRSEQLDFDQLQLGLEDLEQTIAEGETAQDAAAGRQRRAARPRRNHGALPAHLPRHEVVIDVEDKTCPCCTSALHLIGEDSSEQRNRPVRLAIAFGRGAWAVWERPMAADRRRGLRGIRRWSRARGADRLQDRCRSAWRSMPTGGLCRAEPDAGALSTTFAGR